MDQNTNLTSKASPPILPYCECSVRGPPHKVDKLYLKITSIMATNQNVIARQAEHCRQDIARARSELEALGQLIGSKTQHIEHLDARLNSLLTELLTIPDTRDTDLKIARVDADPLAGQHWPAPVEPQPKAPLPTSHSTQAFVSFDQKILGEFDQS